MGGLGNQLFQIAAVYSLAMSNNDIPVFNFDKCYTPLQGNKTNKYKHSIFKHLTHNDKFIAENHYQESSYYFNPINYKPNLLLNGYFQSEKYFKLHKEDILNIFCLDDFKEKALNFLNKIPGNKTSVHIRRGDYIPYQNVMYILDMEYYRMAMSLFKDTSFIIFSDDLEWVKENFKDPNMFIFDNNDDSLNLTCMSLCDNHIIANSTFSWWGAYLNKNCNKKIVAPRKWYSASELIENKDKIPEDWTII